MRYEKSPNVLAEWLEEDVFLIAAQGSEVLHLNASAASAWASLEFEGLDDLAEALLAAGIIRAVKP